jgi:hypothetical protein
MECLNLKYWCFTCNKEVITVEKQVDNEVDIICSNCLLSFIEEIENNEVDNPKYFKVKETNLNNNNSSSQNSSNIRNPQMISLTISNLNNQQRVVINHVNINNQNFQNVLNHFESSTLPMIETITNHNPLINNLLQNLGNLDSNGKPPASKKVIKSLYKEIIDDENLISKFKFLECAICRDDYKEGDVVNKLPCCHYHHIDCIVIWLNKHSTCPVCRYELK